MQKSSLPNRLRHARLSVSCLTLLIHTPALWAAATGRYVRVDDPTGWQMAWSEIEVYSGGENVLFHHPEMLSGTIWPDHKMKTQDGRTLTDGDKDYKKNGASFQARLDVFNEPHAMNPWLEVDLGKPIAIEKIMLYGAQFPGRFYLDKGNRVVTVLDNERKVVWAGKFNYFTSEKVPVFSLEPAAGEKNPAVGMAIPDQAANWAPMGWALDADLIPALPDAERRMKHFAARNSPAEIEKLARRFFAVLDEKTPGLEEAFQLYGNGKYDEALNAWKIYWFAKMKRVNLHWALLGDYWTYPTHGDDLVNGLAVTIADVSARAIRITPGQIHWIDLPDPSNPEFRNALVDCQRKAEVNKVPRALIDAYKNKPDAKYMRCWAEITDDWSLNYFEDAAKSPYEVENLFTFAPALSWQRMMEDLSDLAVAYPEAIDAIPASTLARAQLICIEKYTTAWFRQTRETVFNHLNGGLCAYDPICYYIDEFHSGQQTRQEWKRAVERFITLGTERDGSLTEIGDEGHQEIPVQDGANITYFEQARPVWYTPGWRNAIMEWYDNLFKYMFRHLGPGGYEHRYAVDYRPMRWTSTHKQYNLDRPQLPALPDRDAAILGIPEVRRMLDAWGHISTEIAKPKDPIWKDLVEAQQKTHDQVAAFLGNEKPGLPHINSDWMPYTGAYYFRGGWQNDDPFLAMMACGSHGGSQAPQWDYSMIYHYDYNYPLIAAKPVNVDGLQPQQLFGRMNCFQPGTKTMCLTNADEKPAAHRWLSDERFDFGEALYHGGYQNYPGFQGSEIQPEQKPPGPSVADVDSLRQIVQVRGSRLFIVTDAIQTPGDTVHEFSIPFKVSLSAKQKDASKPFSIDQLQLDEKTGRMASDNLDGPSMTLYQFADQPIQYQMGAAAKADNKHYSRRLTSNIGIADQPVVAKFKGNKLAAVSVISSHRQGDPERIVSIEALKKGGNVGFYAKLKDGGEMWYQSAGMGSNALACGPAQATGQALLVVKEKEALSGLLLGGKNLALNGKPVEINTNIPDFEFVTTGANTIITGIHTPIDPVSFLPNRNTFIVTETVEMVSKTPNIEIRYTTDGTPPVLSSTLYSGPVKITESTEFAARAYRLGVNGKPLPADEFEINGTKFSAPGYGWFYKKPAKPALKVMENELQTGLNYDYLQAPWWTLYASAHWLPASGGGVAGREMDLSKVSINNNYYGMRYNGYVKVPQDGLYTFQAPHEFCYMDNAPSYDLRVYIDGEEWYLTQWWHGHGTWTVPLAKGFHAFNVDFSDARTTPWRRSGVWNYFPKPWAVYKGNPTDILVTGPGLEKTRIPKEWFYSKPEKRTFPDERVLMDSLTNLNCAFDGAVDAPLQGVNEICFKTSGIPEQSFGGLSFVKADGSKHAFAEVAREMAAKQNEGGVFLNLNGAFERLAGSVTVGAKEGVTVVFYNSPAYIKAHTAGGR